MRWLFLVLLVLNVGYVTWELNRGQPQQAVRTALPEGVERIMLLSEMGPETTATEDAVQAAVADSMQTPEPMPAADDATLQQQLQAKTGKGSTLPAVPDSVPVETDAVASLEPDTKAATSPKSTPAADLCYTLGPFREMNTLRLVTREIKDYVVEASFRSKEEQEQTMFRVYVRPVGSKQEAKAMIKELVSKNIRDYFIITDGPNKNGISLGFFSEKSRAYRHADHVRSLGFDATAEPVFRSYIIYWLDYRIKAGNEIPQQIFDVHLENSAQRLSRACN